jgi:hypothetical protein
MRDPQPDSRRDIPLSEIARELAELLEQRRRDAESWSLDFYRIGEGPRPFVSFSVRSGFGQADWTVQRRIDLTSVTHARMPFAVLRREVELAYTKLRDRDRK